MKSKRIKGVIVWDFDRVLFEAERYRLDNRAVWVKRGVPEKVIIGIVEDLHKKKKNFSIAEFIRSLRKRKYYLPDKFIRRIFHDHLLEKEYYSPKTDRLLHRLKKKGFLQMILSMGSAPFQYKKMFIGCGASFRKHFVKMFVTGQPKFIRLRRIRNQYRDLPLIFIDDTKEHLELAQKNVPGVITIYYSNVSRNSLNYLEHKIVRSIKIKKKTVL